VILPERLTSGDTVGLVAPASPPFDPNAIDQSIAALEKMGFRVKPGRSLRQRNGFLAGSDRERAHDLMRMFADRRVKAVLCLRGGYGTARLLPLLDYDVIRQNPKVFVGYSDITSLNCAFLTKADLLNFHGPMPASDFIKSACPDFTRNSWLRTLGQATPAGSICEGNDRASIEVVRGGKVRGEILGSNLSILCSLVGTAYQPDFRGKILVLEDVDEPPYRVDRMLTHLMNAGLLQRVAGVAAGVWRACLDPKVKILNEYRQSVEDVLRERLRPLKVPVVIGLPFGHVPHNVTLPIGGHALLDGRVGDLEITEPAVQ